MKILAVSDVVVDWVYSPRIRLLFSDIDVVISCGDLPQYYLEYIVSSLDKPLLQVYGNHSIPPSILKENNISIGSINMHRKVLQVDGYTFAGIEGCLNYNNGVYQYSQFEMWLSTIMLVPALLRNKMKYGRYLNIMITHAAPYGIHDRPDLAHQGVKAFNWIISAFKPDYLVHGHVHVYRPDTNTETTVGTTRVVNAFQYRKLELPA